MNKLNLPNQLTLLRIILVPVILLFMLPLCACEGWQRFAAGPWASLLALILFILASFTDFLDGYLARSRDLVTNFGKFLDPIADKLLVISVLLALVVKGRVNAWFLLIIIAREFAITGIRLLGAEKGKVIAASIFGKLKTVTQIIAISLLMLEPVADGFAGQPHQTLSRCADFALVLAVVMTLLSAVDYLRKNFGLLQDN